MARRTQARDRLITAAYGLFRRGGFHGTSLAEITAEARMARGSFSFHFPAGKDELAGAVVSFAGASVAQAIEALAVDRNLPEVIDALFVAITEELVASGYHAGCAVAGVALDAWIPETSALLTECARSFRRWVEAIDRLARRDGVGPAEAEPLAWLVITLLEGGLLIARACADPAPLDLARQRAVSAAREALDALGTPADMACAPPCLHGPSE